MKWLKRKPAVQRVFHSLLGFFLANGTAAQGEERTSEILASFAVVQLEGLKRILTDLGVDQAIKNLIIALIYFLILAILFRVLLRFQPRELIINFEDLRRHLADDEKKLKTIRDQAITELFAADLRKVFTIHELAISYCRKHFMNQDVSASETCADMTNIWSQVDIRSVIIDDPAQMALGSSPFHEDLGEITTQTALLGANIPLAAVKRLIQAQKRDNIFVYGSLQNYDSSLLLVAQLRHGPESWAWTQPLGQDQSLPDLINDLSHHVANRIMDQRSKLIQVLPGDHFKQFTDLIRTFVIFLQSQSHVSTVEPNHQGQTVNDKPYYDLKEKIKDFIKIEPSDLRTYYMAYIISLLAIRREDYQAATEFLQHAVKTEPFVVTAISRAGFPIGLHQSPLDLVRRAWLICQQTSPANRLDRAKAMNFTNVIAHVNSTLGFVLERSLGEFNEDPIKQAERLDNAGRAYQKALEYDPTNPLYISNLAEINMKLANRQQPKDFFVEQRLYFRNQAARRLHAACQPKLLRHHNSKFAHLRMGQFCYSLGALEQAKIYYNRAIKEDPDFIVAARNLATVYSTLGDYDAAIETCEGSLSILRLKSSHSSLASTMHGWIHNSMGWAYYLKAKARRKDLEQSLLKPGAYLAGQGDLMDAECQSWLGIAKLNFLESIHLLRDYGQQTVAALNLYLVDLELACLGSLSAVELENAGDQLQDLPVKNIFTRIFQSAIGDSDQFKQLFTTLWIEHQLVPSEYIGVLADLVLFLDYFAECSAASKPIRMATLRKLHPQMETKRGWFEIKTRLDLAVRHIESLLPSSFLGLFYLWWAKPQRAVCCWQSRLDQMDAAAVNLHRSGLPTSGEINSALWRYLYAELCRVFSANPEGIESNLAPPSNRPELAVTLEETFTSLHGPSASRTAGPTNLAFQKTRECASNFLIEAADFSTILIQHGPPILSEAQKTELRKIFAPLEHHKKRLCAHCHHSSWLPIPRPSGSLHR